MTEKWNVIEHAGEKQKVLSSFETRDKAIEYAKKWIKRKRTKCLPFSDMLENSETSYCWERIIKYKKDWEPVGASLWVERE
jgi:hypothetical protein